MSNHYVKFGEYRVSGRESFKKRERVIRCLSVLFRALPFTLFRILYETSSVFSGRASILLRYLFIDRFSECVGAALYVGRFVVVKNLSSLRLGDNVSIHDYCYLDCIGGIFVGDNVSIAHNCSLVSFDHEWQNTEIPIKYNNISINPITIENDVWVGAGVRILAGCHIESRVVIAAGSVVKGRLESNFLYAGVPARKIKPL